jgi:hypothetical protein
MEVAHRSFEINGRLVPTAMTVASTQTRPSFVINRDFALVWLAQALSNLGDFVFTTTLVLWVGADLLPGSSLAPLAVSGLLVTTAVPNLLVAPWAGVLVDRLPKRGVMLFMDAVRACLIVIMLFATSWLTHTLSGESAVISASSTWARWTGDPRAVWEHSKPSTINWSCPEQCSSRLKPGPSSANVRHHDTTSAYLRPPSTIWVSGGVLRSRALRMVRS